MTITTQKSKYGLNNFLRIAESYTNPDLTSTEGIEKAMMAWYVFKFETTFNDPKLLDMTVEELLVLYYMHKIKDNPEILNKEKDKDDFEDWLKAEMGDNYQNEEQMVDFIEKESKEYSDRVNERFKELPQKISTDFSMLGDIEDLGDDNG